MKSPRRISRRRGARVVDTCVPYTYKNIQENVRTLKLEKKKKNQEKNQVSRVTERMGVMS